MGKNINNVIFDLDGTLINSEPAALGATIEALSRFGVSASDTEVREQFGGGSRKIMQYFLDRDLDPLEANRVIDEATDLKVSLQVSFTERVALLPNAKKMLQELKDNGFRLALATMAARDVVDKVTKYHGIDEYFDHVLTANDVVRVKPTGTNTLGNGGMAMSTAKAHIPGIQDQTKETNTSGNSGIARSTVKVPILIPKILPCL